MINYEKRKKSSFRELNSSEFSNRFYLILVSSMNELELTPEQKIQRDLEWAMKFIGSEERMIHRMLLKHCEDHAENNEMHEYHLSMMIHWSKVLKALDAKYKKGL